MHQLFVVADTTTVEKKQAVVSYLLLCYGFGYIGCKFKALIIITIIKNLTNFDMKKVALYCFIFHYNVQDIMLVFEMITFFYLTQPSLK